MRTFAHLIEAVTAGHRPVVQFNPGIGELVGYPEKGVWARVVDAHDGQDGFARVTFDFTEFDERNRSFETARFPRVGDGFQTARQAGLFRPVETVAFDITADVVAYFSLERTQGLALFKSYIESGAQQGYVSWLEEWVATAFGHLARDLPVQQPEPALESANPFASTPPAVRQQHILLCGPFVAAASSSNYSVASVSVPTKDYVADVHIRLDRPAHHSAHLYDDPVFIASVMAKLRAAGYEGPDFGRSELGMQSRAVVVLEPGREFDAWVATKGFVKLD